MIINLLTTSILKIILRSKIFNFLYSILPKSVALKIAEKISYERKDSHQINNELLEKIHNELIKFSRKKWKEGSDLVIMGHYHHSFHYTVSKYRLQACTVASALNSRAICRLQMSYMQLVSVCNQTI